MRVAILAYPFAHGAVSARILEGTLDVQTAPEKQTAPAGAVMKHAGVNYTASSSTSKISVAFGGITPPAPRAP
jgi:ethanolamine utilization protein EutQ (cupin superfamily)